MARNKDITVKKNRRMRNDNWDGEIIVLSLLRKIILSSEYYEPAYDTLIGNLRIHMRNKTPVSRTINAKRNVISIKESFMRDL